MTTTDGKSKIASDTVKVQLAALTLENEQLKKRLTEKENENVVLRKQNVELASVIENDLKADLTLQIMAASDFKEADLENLSIEQLQTMVSTLSKRKAGDAIFKPIRAGASTDKASRLTVGNLYGKTRAEILAMEGDF